jgi:Type III restriction enzyme, res subunit/Pretoxin HINT domain
MTIQLRAYQQDVLDRARRRIGSGLRRGIIQGQTGSGKTVVGAELCRAACAKGSRTLVLADRRRLVHQFGNTLDAFGVKYGKIMAGETGATREPVILASRDTLAAWANNSDRERRIADIVIVDECLPAGTLVDGRPIETVQVGDMVSSFDEHTGHIVARRVTAIFRKPAPAKLVSVSASGSSVTATANHPFLTTRGWINAGDIKVGDEVCGLFQDVRRPDWASENKVSARLLGTLVQPPMLSEVQAYSADQCQMPPMRTNFPNEGTTQGIDRKRQAGVLLSGMLAGRSCPSPSRKDVGDESAVVASTNAGSEPEEGSAVADGRPVEQ